MMDVGIATPGSNRFQIEHKQLSGEQSKNIKDVKDLAAQLEKLILSNGETRETSLALTKLEESVFWVTKHLSR